MLAVAVGKALTGKSDWGKNTEGGGINFFLPHFTKLPFKFYSLTNKGENKTPSQKLLIKHSRQHQPSDARLVQVCSGFSHCRALKEWAVILQPPEHCWGNRRTSLMFEEHLALFPVSQTGVSSDISHTYQTFVFSWQGCFFHVWEGCLESKGIFGYLHSKVKYVSACAFS